MATIAEQLTSLANTKTAIKDAIVAKGVAVADTDPFSAYAGKIGEISGGGGGAPATKYGVSIDNMLGNVDANGQLSVPYGEFVFNGAGIKSLGTNALAYKFAAPTAYACLPIRKILLPDLLQVSSESLRYVAYNAYSLTEVDLGLITDINSTSVLLSAFESAYNLATVRAPNVTTISGYSACEYAFRSTGLTSNAFPNLTTISGSSACRYMYAGCTFDELGLDNLVTISGGTACQYMFQGLKIDEARFPKLESITGSMACRYWFSGSTVKKVYFPALTTVDESVFGSASYNGAFSSCSQLTEIHFRADAQATIEAMDGYSAKWGATNATIYFDL